MIARKVWDHVSWISQANGGWTRKIGVISQVIPAGSRPVDIKGCGLPRDHESYVIAVQVGKGKAAPRLYWPRVSALESVWLRCA